MKFACFVTGTDTGIGKTYATLALMTSLKALGYRVNGMKPIASGGSSDAGGLNEDALQIKNMCSVDIPYRSVNPYLFAEPIAPHIAANKEKREISLDSIRAKFLKIKQNSDAMIIEGIGGWRVPLSSDIQTVDLVRTLNLPLILVVGLRLGCISHALLTIEAIRRDNIQSLGWIANHLDREYAEPQATIETIKAMSGMNYLGEIPCMDIFKPEIASQNLQLDEII